MITLDLSILNQKGTPMFFSDLTANRPAAGIVGRIFIATDSPYGIFRDTGSAWNQIAGSGGGGGNTIYTANDTLTGNRTVSDGGFGLSFTSTTYIGTAAIGSGSGKLIVGSSSADNGIQIFGANSPSLRLDNAQSGGTQRFVIGLSTATNNFIQGSAAGQFCISTASSGAMLFGMWQTINASEVFRISTANNLILGSTTDSGQKFQVTGTMKLAGDILATGTNENISIHILNEGQSVGFRSILVGRTGGSVTGVGIGFSVSSAGGVAVGGATSTGGGVSIGNSVTSTGGTAVGPGAISLDGVSLGNANSNFQAIAIGNSVRSVATSSSVNAIAIGNFSYSVDGTFVSGSSVRPITEIYFGSGITNLRGDLVQTTGAGTSYTINGSGAFGTDFSGGNVTIAGGKGTGNAAGGDVIITTSDKGSTGTTLQTLAEAMRVKADTQNVLIGSTTDQGKKLYLNGSLRIDGQSSASAGGSSGLHLIINLDGTDYKIALLNV